MTSRDLPLNGVKPFEMCGKQCVAFRGGSGAVHVLSAYCPHLGANLGVGGHVVTESESGDDCIQCPFHGWRFGGDGQCKRIPNLNESELNAVKAVVKKWQTIEKNEVIYVWHHSEDKDPNHYPKDFLGKNYHNLSLIGSYLRLLHCNYQIILENGSDFQHFNYRHQVLIPYITSLKFSFDSTYETVTEITITGRMTIYLLGMELVTVPIKLCHVSPVTELLYMGTDESMLGTVLSLATLEVPKD
ncbi:unnamed protein product [Medioppia subpectinata]|uniref:Rieske domain-containing protein n=1 Tax=Medioppia subpectinata TaxID=1979941 RepID=A0A7R9PWJ1_9ACAR|nr:unnamed protein product [Medioppia subpectinata]CAG2102954.1 unnamed protein product [Medioppia subpectinata]